MATKSIRTGVYALLKFKNQIVVIKKGRGPFEGLYDLPGGKIEHGEGNINSLKREIIEEVGISDNDFIIEKLLTVEEDFVKHTWKDEKKDEHIIAIIYLVKITKDSFDLNYTEKGGDADGLKLISLDDNSLGKTNILKKAINKAISD